MFKTIKENAFEIYMLAFSVAMCVGCGVILVEAFNIVASMPH